MQRVAIVGDGPAALSTAERLIGAGMCVDLVCAKPAPFGLLRRFAGLAGVRHEAAASPCPPAPPRACAFSATCAWAKAAKRTSPPASSASWPHTVTAAFYLSSLPPAAWPLPLGKGYASPPSNPKTGPPSPAARNLRQSAFSRLLA